MTKPCVSFVIPTWNRREELARLLSSFTIQDRCDFEIIVVDNGSTDETAQWLQKNHEHVVLIANHQNKGAAHAKNQGTKAAKSDWIWFLDSDSLLLDGGVVRRAMDLVEQHPEIGAIGGEIFPGTRGLQECRIKRHRFNGETYNVVRKGDIHLETCDYVPTCNCLVRSDLLKSWGGFDPDYFIFCEDDELGMAVRKAGYFCFFDSRLNVGHMLSSSSRRPGLWRNNRNRLRMAVLNFSVRRLALLPLAELREAFRLDNLSLVSNMSDRRYSERYLSAASSRNETWRKIVNGFAFLLGYASTLLAAYVYTAVTLPGLLLLRRQRPNYLDGLSDGRGV